MRLRASAVLVFFICLLLAGPSSVAAPREFISLQEYQANLAALDAKIEQLRQNRRDLADFLREMPSSWTVRDGSMEFTVSTGWARTGLLEMPLDPDKAQVAAQKLHERVQLLRSEATSYPGRYVEGSERQRLNDILARREFRFVAGPSFWDLVKQKILTWVIKLLAKIFGSAAVPVIGKTVAWVAILAAVAIFCLWVWRLLNRGALIPSIATDASAISAKSWTEWLAEAQAAGQRGEWRDAIRLAYWAGISNLETRGLWLPDRARTPREYLRLLPAATEYGLPLQKLTQVFERVWYGNQSPGPELFAETVSELSKMGCR